MNAMADMLRIIVRPFGPATDVLGSEPIEYALMPPATLGLLVELLVARHPGLRAFEGRLRFAVNEEYAGFDTVLREGDEVAVIPPVAGGGEEPVLLTDAPIDVAALARAVAGPACGAVVTFEGVVRAEGSPDNPLVALSYSAHPSMAVRQMRRLRKQARERFEIHDVAIAHRVGRLEIGEASVVVVVSAGHRGAAFDACRWVIDTLKQDVPIWKQEIWTQGEPTWVDPTA